MRMFVGLLSSATLAMAAGPVLAATWACGANAAFDGGKVEVYIKVDGKAGPDPAVTVNYSPAPPEKRLKMMVQYPARFAGEGQYEPSAAFAMAETSDHSGTDIVLTVGGKSFRQPLAANMPGLSGSKFRIYVSFPVTPELDAALAKGGGGKLEILDREGHVQESQELTFATPGAIRQVSAQAYKAASGYASNPGHSQFCVKTNGF